MATIVTVAQQKGGAGKTTLAAHLAIAWTLAGKSVAAIDIDPQQSLTAWHQARSQRFSDAQASISVSQVRGWRVRGEVERLADLTDIVVIDSPPHAETEAKIAVRTADLVVIPVQPSPMDVWACRETLTIAKQEKVPALLVLNRVPARAKLTEAMAFELTNLGAMIAETTIGNRVGFAAALAAGMSVSESQPSGRASEEITALALEILKVAGDEPQSAELSAA